MERRVRFVCLGSLRLSMVLLSPEFKMVNWLSFVLKGWFVTLRTRMCARPGDNKAGVVVSVGTSCVNGNSYAASNPKPTQAEHGQP